MMDRNVIKFLRIVFNESHTYLKLRELRELMRHEGIRELLETAYKAGFIDIIHPSEDVEINYPTLEEAISSCEKEGIEYTIEVSNYLYKHYFSQGYIEIRNNRVYIKGIGEIPPIGYMFVYTRVPRAARFYAEAVLGKELVENQKIEVTLLHEIKVSTPFRVGGLPVSIMLSEQYDEKLGKPIISVVFSVNAGEASKNKNIMATIKWDLTPDELPITDKIPKVLKKLEEMAIASWILYDELSEGATFTFVDLWAGYEGRDFKLKILRREAYSESEIKAGGITVNIKTGCTDTPTVIYKVPWTIGEIREENYAFYSIAVDKFANPIEIVVALPEKPMPRHIVEHGASGLLANLFSGMGTLGEGTVREAFEAGRRVADENDARFLLVVKIIDYMSKTEDDLYYPEERDEITKKTLYQTLIARKTLLREEKPPSITGIIEDLSSKGLLVIRDGRLYYRNIPLEEWLSRNGVKKDVAKHIENILILTRLERAIEKKGMKKKSSSLRDYALALQ